jgi:hypothetical protein
MRRLSQQQFARARQFLQTQGRSVERAMFAYAFGEGGVSEVAHALAKYQNADGGFGHALESDVRTPSSSALATSIGLGLLRDAGLPADAPQVASAVRYLVETLDPDTHVWRIIPTDANEHPHAPWWHDEDGSVERAFGGFAVNPRAELVGQLWTYASAVPDGWLAGLTERTLADIESRELDAHELICAVRLAETEKLPDRYKDRLRPRLVERAQQLVAREPEAWKQYNPQPLWYVSTPKSLLADPLANSIPANLDFLIDQQTDAGAWVPNWDWGPFYPETWPQAKLDASSMLTLRALRQLRAFGRIEGMEGQTEEGA